MNSDNIYIRDLQLFAKIGVHPWERKHPQLLIFNIELVFDCTRAMTTDRLEDALNYQQVVNLVKEIVASNQKLLLEGLAETLIHAIFKDFDVTAITLQIDKPKAIAEAQAAGIRVTRTSKRSILPATEQ